MSEGRTLPDSLNFALSSLNVPHRVVRLLDGRTNHDLYFGVLKNAYHDLILYEIVNRSKFDLIARCSLKMPLNILRGYMSIICMPTEALKGSRCVWAGTFRGYAGSFLLTCVHAKGLQRGVFASFALSISIYSASIAVGGCFRASLNPKCPHLMQRCAYLPRVVDLI